MASNTPKPSGPGGPGMAKAGTCDRKPRPGSLIWQWDGGEDGAGVATAVPTVGARRGADGDDDAARAAPAPLMSAVTATAAVITGLLGLTRAGIMTGLPPMCHWAFTHRPARF